MVRTVAAGIFRISGAAVSAALMWALAPAAAGAASTIGQTFPPAAGGSSNLTNLQSTSPGNLYAAPSDGVITSWSFHSGPNPAELPDQMKLEVARPAGLNLFLSVGESKVEAPALDALSTFDTRIPVKAGDVIGFWFDNGGLNAASGRAAPGYALHYFAGDRPPGSTDTYVPFDAPATQLDISASLETTPCAGRKPTMVGTGGSDSLTGTSGPDVILALGGNDLVDGLGGADTVCGGLGKDLLRGGPGKDTLRGEGGRDVLKGGGGRDVCVGGPARDSAGACEKRKKI
jgi:Ca2+-binding RTX toxin-like protein